MSDEVKGYYWLAHFDDAMVTNLGADFLPYPNPQNNPALSQPINQVGVPGVCGSGLDERVVVTVNTPPEELGALPLPFINIRNTSDEDDPTRRFGYISGRKYRYKAPESDDVEVDGRHGASHYVTRRHAEPTNIFYEIEVRARFHRDAQIMARFVRSRLVHQSDLLVLDSQGERGRFALFRTGMTNTSELADVLQRFSSYVISYKVQGQLDDHDEVVEVAARQINAQGRIITKE